MAPAWPPPPPLSLGADLIHLRFINRLKKKKVRSCHHTVPSLLSWRFREARGRKSGLQGPSGSLNPPSSPHPSICRPFHLSLKDGVCGGGAGH